MCDATVIGGGPGGSLAAFLLSRGGWDVTLIEQHRFPRSKVCGECLSAEGMEVLGRAGLLNRLEAFGPARFVRALLHAPDSPSVSAPLPRPMMGVSRDVLDSYLLDAARSAGVRVLQPARCEALLPDQDAVTIRVRDLQTNAVSELHPSQVIVADGKSALPGSAPAPTRDMGIKCHWVGVDGPRDAIELFGCAGCYGGLAAIEGDRWNSAFSVPAERVRAQRGDLDALFGALLEENPMLARRLTGARRTGPWLAAPLPRFAVQKKRMPGVIPVGNAAAALEPIGGEGMGLALRSAELAANALLESDGQWDAARDRSLRKQYQRLWRTRRLACRAAALLVSSEPLASSALPLFTTSEPLARGILQAMGK